MIAARAAVLVATMLLVGCSGEPGVSNIKEAMLGDPKSRAGYELAKSINPQAGSYEDFITNSAVIEKGDCVEASSEPGWLCDLRVGMRIGDRTQFGQWAKVRFFKVNGSWNMEERR